MQIDIHDLLQWAGGVAIAFSAWLWRELGAIRSAHAKHQTHVAETYVTKTDLKDSLQRVYDALDRIEKKIDSR